MSKKYNISIIVVLLTYIIIIEKLFLSFVKIYMIINTFRRVYVCPNHFLTAYCNSYYVKEESFDFNFDVFVPFIRRYIIKHIYHTSTLHALYLFVY